MRVRIRDVVAPVFWPVHRAIARGTVQELVAKGGRGSGKSSYISIELVLQLLRHPACHAVVLRKIGGTLRTSSGPSNWSSSSNQARPMAPNGTLMLFSLPGSSVPKKRIFCPVGR